MEYAGDSSVCGERRGNELNGGWERTDVGLHGVCCGFDSGRSGGGEGREGLRVASVHCAHFHCGTLQDDTTRNAVECPTKGA